MESSDILGVITLVAVFLAGYIYREFKFINDWVKLNTSLQSQLQGVDAQLKEKGVREVRQLNHEIIDGVNYFFTTDGSFAGQGTTLDDAAKHWTQISGPEQLGLFKHVESNEEFYFLNNQCLQLQNEK